MYCGLATPVELKTKWSAKGGERPLGGVGLGSFKGNIVHLAGGGASAFPGAMAFPDNGCPIRLHRDADPGDIDG